MKKKILVTGASGFIGSFVVEEALRRGFDVWAAVRTTSSRAYLTDSRINTIELDFSSTEKLAEKLKGHDFEYIVHAAGVTKCLDTADFMRINCEGTQHLVEALKLLNMPLKRMVYISSLSVMGAIRESMPYSEIKDSDLPQPNTAYGRSKLAAEQWLAEHAAPLPYVVLRPTGVYGPRERDYFMQVKSISQHVDFAVGFSRQDITFVYVTDVVQAVFLALEKGRDGAAYFLSDGLVYTSADYSRLVRRELGNPWWIRLTAPIWVLRLVTTCGEYVGRITHRVTALNKDKFNILRQRNWRCDISPARRELGYEPQVMLDEGVRRSVKWYKDEGWI